MFLDLGICVFLMETRVMEEDAGRRKKEKKKDRHLVVVCGIKFRAGLFVSYSERQSSSDSTLLQALV